MKKVLETLLKFPMPGKFFLPSAIFGLKRTKKFFMIPYTL